MKFSIQKSQFAFRLCFFLAIGASLTADVVYSEANLQEAQSRFSKLRIFDDSQVRANVFGSSYFINNSTDTLTMNQNKPVQADYVLGPGDVFLIKIRGVINEEHRVEVNNRGVLSFAKIPTIYVAGLTLSQARDEIAEYALEAYKNVDVEVELIDLKNIDVIATGNVNRPGAYTVRSNYTALDLLYICGGPTEKGSFRSIELTRNKVNSDGSKIIETTVIDLYNVFLLGRHDSILLEAGDRLYVPNIGNTATIAGQVKYPAQYEWSDGSTLKDLIAMCGGFTPNANITRVELSRKSEDNTYHFFEIDYSQPKNQTMLLKDGDIFRIPNRMEILKEKCVVVDINGRVNYPGRYILPQNTRLSALIESAGGLQDDAFLNGAMLTRKSLESEQQRIQKKVMQDLEAQILKFQANLAESAILSDDQKLLMKAQSLRQNIIRSQGEILYEGRLIFDPSQEDPVLLDQDEISIPSEPNSVTVIGAVYNSGTLTFHEDWSVDDYLNHVGGATSFADENGIYVLKPYGHVLNIKTNGKSLQVEKGDAIVVPLDAEMLAPINE
ncbi:MAG: SLBB domain-containing protein [Candidatus Omnitrophica bacterium]|nr:SLBB domain-containing protein [Candidatus Omnitrophota bacterium]